MQQACEVAVPMKVERKYGAPCETKELRELIHFRNRYHRYMHANRGLWTAVSRCITELTIRNQRTIWQDHL